MYISFVWFILFEKLKSQSHLITAIHKLKPIHQLGYNVYFMQKINDSFRTVYSFSLNKNQRVKCTRDLLCSTRELNLSSQLKKSSKNVCLALSFTKYILVLCASNVILHLLMNICIESIFDSHLWIVLFNFIYNPPKRFVVIPCQKTY